MTKITSNEFEEIIKNTDFLKFENLSKNSCRKVYKIKLNNINYILKIINSKTIYEFELITKTIKLLNKNNFPTAKLYFSKYETITKNSYFLFEYLEHDENYKVPINEIINIIKEFYNITKNILNIDNENQIIKQLKEGISKIPIVHQKIILNIILELEQEKSKNQLILFDLNPTNLIYYNNQNYLIDFDELIFSEIEYDIASVILNFILNINQDKSFEKNLNEISNVIIEFKNNNISILKIFNYLIINLYTQIYNIIKNNLDKKIQRDILKQILFFLKNKEIILKNINIMTHK